MRGPVLHEGVCPHDAGLPKKVRIAAGEEVGEIAGTESGQLLEMDEVERAGLVEFHVELHEVREHGPEHRLPGREDARQVVDPPVQQLILVHLDVFGVLGVAQLPDRIEVAGRHRLGAVARGHRERGETLHLADAQHRVQEAFGLLEHHLGLDSGVVDRGLDRARGRFRGNE